MKLEKALQRDRKINKRRSGMKVDNRSIFTIQEIQKKKADEIKREREEKERRQFLELELQNT
jgi:hypothetical protein